MQTSYLNKLLRYTGTYRGFRMTKLSCIPYLTGLGSEMGLGRGSALPRLGAELELRRSGSSLGPSQ